MSSLALTTWRWHVIGRGFAGWHAEGVNVSSSGGQLMPYTYWTGEQCSGYLSEAVEGALVYDVSHLERDEVASEAFMHLVISGPIVKPSLPPDGVSRFGKSEREAALMMSPALGGAFKTYALAAQAEGFSGLDYVGVGVYEALLRTVPGIKIGHVHNGEVVWEET